MLLLETYPSYLQAPQSSLKVVAGLEFVALIACQPIVAMVTPNSPKAVKKKISNPKLFL